ncbi:hypothetical protein [Sandaracinus amylolyticus]|uniref:Uncharacterized protein n=1 Tax=Sandaracinus amylolyticus TaxID=927083 RepID=A0A0F6YMP6_9BACT|nr:hypothetical protein [Sandaracinus amylolyticus]AKF10557.1 hypothetical protein DB32_007706 [Sandaracinus amylolyticus]
MYQVVQKCQGCGAGLTLDDMRKTQCPYCQVVYPHHSQAAQHAQVAGAMMNQMMAQAGYVQSPYAPPPLGGGPPGGPPPAVITQAYGDPSAIVAKQAQAMGRGIAIVMIVSTLVVLGMMAAGVAVALVLLR